MATDGRPPAVIRWALLLSLLVLPGFLSGCSLFRHGTKPSVEVEAPAGGDPKSTTPAAKDASTERKKSPATTRPAAPAPKPKATPDTNGSPVTAPTDSIAPLPDPPPQRPTVSPVLTAERRSTLEVQYRTDVERANQALDSLKGRVLTVTEAEQRTSAERFLTESQAAFDAGDLPRASSLVEKARVIAEELKSSTAPK